MSTLKRQEALGPGCRRLLCDSIESAIRELTHKDGSGTVAAEALDRASGQLALVEPHLPRDLARRERHLLERTAQDIRLALQPIELLTKLEALADQHGVDLGSGPAKAMRKALNKKADTVLALNAPNRSFDPLVYRLVADLAELRGRVGDWPELDLPDDRPPTGLRRTYTAARRAAQNPPTTPPQAERAAAALTHLARQLTMLGRCCQPMIKPQRKLLASAAKDMRDHLTTLRLRAMLDTEEHRGWADPILQADASTQVETRLAQLLGAALAESPAAFTRRLGVYWANWRAA